MRLTPEQLATRIIVYATAIDYGELCWAIADVAHALKKDRNMLLGGKLESIEKRIEELSKTYKVERSREICGLDKPSIFYLPLEFLKAKDSDNALIEIESIRKTIEDKVKAMDDYA